MEIDKFESVNLKYLQYDI
uniref:Uncharacterized protein n=1 Tax=Strongyloides stercoralis TaxID=6248 RepID=A0A0K0EPE5_STRER